MSAGRITLGLIVAVTVSCAPRDADEQPADVTASGDIATATAAEWVAAPELPPGAQIAVISGNPGGPGPFTVHLRVPNDYRFPPHTHSSAETVTTVSGILHVGMGGTYDMSGDITELGPGQSMDIAANSPHFGHAAGETVIEIRSTGPFEIAYVSPADDPRR